MENTRRFQTNPFMTREERRNRVEREKEENEAKCEAAIDEGVAAFILALEDRLSGYEPVAYFNQKFEEIMSEHNIDLVAHRLYDDHGLKFLDLLISNNEGEFESYEICFG